MFDFYLILFSVYFMGCLVGWLAIMKKFIDDITKGGSNV